MKQSPKKTDEEKKETATKNKDKMPPLRSKSESSQDGIYSVSYDSGNHVSVITQLHGSVWKDTFKYCLINAIITGAVHYLKIVHDIDLGITDKGHTMMTLFVSFLIVSRVSISLGRYNESHGNLGKMYREARELVQNMVVFTKGDQSITAKQWRNDLAYDISILLRLSMAVIDYPSENIPCWTIPELSGSTKDYILSNLDYAKSLSHHGDAELNMRVPIQMGYYLRDKIFTVNQTIKGDSNQIAPWQFGRLFGSLDSYMGGYYGMRKFMTTPFPFPLVQMARTLLFLYLYTLPFALLDQPGYPGTHVIIVFLVTYGFVGLETVSIQLDDPFGHDDNDFDNLGMAYVRIIYKNIRMCFAFRFFRFYFACCYCIALVDDEFIFFFANVFVCFPVFFSTYLPPRSPQTALEDTLITICNADGEEWMMKLQERLAPPEVESGEPNEQTSLV